MSKKSEAKDASEERKPEPKKMSSLEWFLKGLAFAVVPFISYYVGEFVKQQAYPVKRFGLGAVETARDLDMYVWRRRNTDEFGAIDKFPPSDKFPFTLVVGDDAGIKYVQTFSLVTIPGLPQFVQSHPCQMYRINSASKLVTVSAIGHAISKSSNGFSFDSKVGDFLDFWPTDASDIRSTITLTDLLSGTSGVECKLFDNLTNFCYPNTAGENNFYGCAKFVLENCLPNADGPKPGTEFRYHEGNYLVAQAMTLKATGEDTWLAFMNKYFATPLGLEYQPWVDASSDCTGESSHNVKVVNGTSNSFSFTCEKMAWGGWDYRFSPIAYSKFLTAFTSGAYECGRDVIETAVWSEQTNSNWRKIYKEENVADLGKHDAFGRGYALGGWTVDHVVSGDDQYKRLRHCIGWKGSVPVMSETKDGKRFWYYIGAYSDMHWTLDMVNDRPFLDAVRQFVEYNTEVVDVEEVCREDNERLPEAWYIQDDMPQGW